MRKHIDEFGLIPEAEVLAGNLDFADMVRLPKEEEEYVLRAMHLMVVDRGLCIRQHVPNDSPLLVFPSLYKRERPPRPSHPLVLMTFRFEGHLDEIYATLVVRLHYTDAFKYKQFWLDAADFTSLTDEKIGLKKGAGLVQRGFARTADEALGALRQAIQNGFRDKQRLQKDPALAPLRSRPDFQMLLSGMSHDEGKK